MAVWRARVNVLQKLRRGAARMAMGPLAAGFAQWQAVCRGHHRFAYQERVIRKLMHSEAVRAWHTWRVATRNAKSKAADVVRRRLLGTLACSAHAGLRGAWQCWQRCVLLRARGVARKQHADLAKAEKRIVALEKSERARPLGIEPLMATHDHS